MDFSRFASGHVAIHPVPYSPLNAGLGLATDALGANVVAVCLTTLLSSFSRLTSLVTDEVSVSVSSEAWWIWHGYLNSHGSRSQNKPDD